MREGHGNTNNQNDDNHDDRANDDSFAAFLTPVSIAVHISSCRILISTTFIGTYLFWDLFPGLS